MKITVSKSELYNKLKIVGKVVGNSKTMPQVENFLFEIGSEFTITGSDILGVITGKVNTLSIENKNNATVKFLVDKTIMSALKELADQPIEMIISEDNLHVTVNYNNGMFDFVGADANSFPMMIKSDNIVESHIAKSFLIDGIKSVIPFVANDELRPVMNGVFMQSLNNNLVFCATDSHMLSVREFTECNYPDFGAIIPSRAARMIIDIVSESKSEMMDVSISMKNITVSTETYTLTYRLVEGKYPNFRAVIPKTHNSSLVINADEFQSAIRRVAVFANRNSLLIKLEIGTGGVIKIDAKDIDFSVSASETLFAEFDGAPVEIGFHGNRLIDILSAIPSEDCIAKFIDGSRAAIFHPVGIEGITLLLMPMLLNN